MRWKIYDNRSLVPSSWRHLANGPEIWCFNPTMLKINKGWVFVYRIVLTDQRRRIAACFLDDDQEVIQGSQVALSDYIRFPQEANFSDRAKSWFADPRIYDVGDRLVVHFNTGWHMPHNHQFIVPIDPETLLPLELAREINLVKPRQNLEKNWVFLGKELDLLVYSPDPHRTAKQVGEDKLSLYYELHEELETSAILRTGSGQLRGGAPPVRRGDFYYSFCHMIVDVEGSIDYQVAVYRFHAMPPFKRLPESLVMLNLLPPLTSQRLLPKLNPAVGRVIYPSGAVLADSHWHLACGLNDEYCAIVSITESHLDLMLSGLSTSADSHADPDKTEPS
jgi:hypothetical protein